MNITWHPEAQAEFEADVDWYDEREVGLGDRFEHHVVVAVGAAADDPTAWRMWPGWDRRPAVRTKGVTDFPYRVVYFVDGALLTIVAVAHAKRCPGYWRERIDGR